jgi:hypothetical protein
MALRSHKPTARAVESAVRFLIAGCGSYVLAFPAGWVRGILTSEEAGPGHEVRWAGASYPLTDLAYRLLLASAAESIDRRVILYGNGTCLCAFAVDRVFELIDTNRMDLRPLPVQFRGTERTRLSGILFYKNTIALIVNPLWLLETNRRIDAFQACMTMDGTDTPSCDAAASVPHVQIPAEPVK